MPLLAYVFIGGYYGSGRRGGEVSFPSFVMYNFLFSA